MEHVEWPIKEDTVYEGRIFTVRKDIVMLENGTNSVREVVYHSGGVCIVPVDIDNMVYCVNQFRYLYLKELLELPAGKLEKDEKPIDCAVRELSEETGLVAESVISLGHIYPTPGYCSEVLHIFLATGLTQGEAHQDPGEFLSVKKIPLEEIIDMIYSNEIKDAKTIAGILKAAYILSKSK